MDNLTQIQEYAERLVRGETWTTHCEPATPEDSEVMTYIDDVLQTEEGRRLIAELAKEIMNEDLGVRESGLEAP